MKFLKNIFKKSEHRKLVEKYMMADSNKEQKEIAEKLGFYPYL